MLFCTLSLFNLQQIPRACHVKGINIWKSIQHKDSNWLKWLINISSICGQKRCMTNTRPQPTSGMRKCSFFVTNAGSQLTFMTQNEKVMIFRDQRGATTDLHDTEWESDHFSWPTRGHNWPFRCLDRRLAGLEFLTKPNNHSFSTVVKRDKYNLRY